MDSSRARRGRATRERITQPMPHRPFGTGKRQIIDLIRKPTGLGNRSGAVRNPRVGHSCVRFDDCCFLYSRRYNSRCAGSSQKPTFLWTPLQPSSMAEIGAPAINHEPGSAVCRAVLETCASRASHVRAHSGKATSPGSESSSELKTAGESAC